MSVVNNRIDKNYWQFVKYFYLRLVHTYPLFLNVLLHTKFLIIIFFTINRLTSSKFAYCGVFFSEIVDEWPYCRSVSLHSCHETIALRTVSPSTSSLHCNYCTRLWRRFHGTGLYWKWNSQSPELTFQGQWQDLNIKTDGAYELDISGYVAAVLDERNDGRFAWILYLLAAKT